MSEIGEEKMSLLFFFVSLNSDCKRNMCFEEKEDDFCLRQSFNQSNQASGLVLLVLIMQDLVIS